MARVASHLWLASSVRIANVWIIDTSSGRFVVDTGHPVERIALLGSLWRAGVRRRGDLAGVLLTHRHSDHAGNAAWIRRRFDCPVICHRADAAALSGASAPPRLARGKARLHEEVLCWIEDRLPARSPVDEVLDEGAWRSGFRVVPVPGHTEGSVMLYHEPTATLFSGDAIIAGPAVIRGIEWLRLAVAGFSLDVDACHEAVRRFLRAMPRTDAFCSGHGPPIREDVRAKLLRLAERSEAR
jgi:glyoxylase-like metal-dependent hydrolase (beta-lactamase superfamily II)